MKTFLSLIVFSALAIVVCGCGDSSSGTTENAPPIPAVDDPRAAGGAGGNAPAAPSTTPPAGG